jgi:hypothetical protein
MLTLACLSVAAPVPAAVSIVATPESPLLDQRLAIRISGLNPNTTVRVSAKSQAQDALTWRSEALFTVGERGQIDLDHQAPQSGTYGGIDGMGLFWSMRPDKQPKAADHLSFAIEDFSKPFVTSIEVTDINGATTAALIERRYASVDVRNLAVPTGGNWQDSPVAIGGTAGGMAKAQANAWPPILKFLSDAADKARSDH